MSLGRLGSYEILERIGEGGMGVVFRAHDDRLDRGLVQAHLARASILRETGRAREAIRELRQALLVNPNVDATHVLLGHAYRKLGDFERAEASYRRAVSLRHAWWANWLALANFEFGRADYLRARAAYQRVVQLLPESNRGYEGLGAVSLAQGRYADAIATYRRLPKPAAMDAAPASNIATGYQFSGRLPAGDSEVLHDLAKAHALCGRGAQAMAALRGMIQPGSPPDLFRDEDEFRGLRDDAEFRRLVSARRR